MRTTKILDGRTVLAHDDGRSKENGEAFAKTYWDRKQAEQDAAALNETAHVELFFSNNRAYYLIIITEETS